MITETVTTVPQVVYFNLRGVNHLLTTGADIRGTKCRMYFCLRIERLYRFKTPGISFDTWGGNGALLSPCSELLELAWGRVRQELHYSLTITGNSVCLHFRQH